MNPAAVSAPTSFNPVLGFLPTSTGAAVPGRTRPPCFNPVLGFLPTSTSDLDDAAGGDIVFQSRSGFSPYFDVGNPHGLVQSRLVSIPFWVFSLLRPPSLRVARRLTCFNPVLGFLPTSTRSATATSSRRHCFNPVLGFLPTSTGCRPPAGRPAASFNPVLGFLPTSTASPSPLFPDIYRFQSRSGFSPYFDILLNIVTRHGTCFNPVLGFLPTSTAPLTV